MAGGALWDLGSRAINKIFGGGSYRGSSRLSELNTTLFSQQKLTKSFKEKIGDVIAPSVSTYSASTYVMNPSIVETFKQLSQYAALFRKYRFLQMAAVFVPTETVAISNAGVTGLGKIAMTYLDDFAKINTGGFTSFDEQERYAGSIITPINVYSECFGECRSYKFRDEFILRNNQGNVPVGYEQADSDQLALVLGFNGLNSATYGQNIGELWLYGTVEFTEEQVIGDIYARIPYAHYNFGGSNGTTAIFGTTQTSVSGALTMSFNNSTAIGTLYAPPGVYLFLMVTSGVGPGTLSASYFAVSDGTTILNVLNGGGSVTNGIVTGVTNNVRVFSAVVFNMPNATNIQTFSLLNAATSDVIPPGYDIIVVPIPLTFTIFTPEFKEKQMLNGRFDDDEKRVAVLQNEVSSLKSLVSGLLTRGDFVHVIDPKFLSVSK
jgi:hypothetical protein